jgi:hypothetical protein
MTVKTIVTQAYTLAILAVMVWGPLIALHGYRQWWVVTFYAIVASATIGGIVSHHRMVRRDRLADPASRRHRHLPRRQHRTLPAHA